MYELHATMVQLAKKLFDGREITGTEYLVRVVCTEIIANCIRIVRRLYSLRFFQDELMRAEKYLKRALEMLFIEPGNSPEGELCAKALEEYRALKATMGTVLDAIHAEDKTYFSLVDKEEQV